jgi:hypothetical protein
LYSSKEAAPTERIHVGENCFSWKDFSLERKQLRNHNKFVEFGWPHNEGITHSHVSGEHGRTYSVGRASKFLSVLVVVLYSLSFPVCELDSRLRMSCLS